MQIYKKNKAILMQNAEKQKRLTVVTKDPCNFFKKML